MIDCNVERAGLTKLLLVTDCYKSIAYILGKTHESYTKLRKHPKSCEEIGRTTGRGSSLPSGGFVCGTVKRDASAKDDRARSVS
jgi:hypothetical protein